MKTDMTVKGPDVLTPSCITVEIIFIAKVKIFFSDCLKLSCSDFKFRDN